MAQINIMALRHSAFYAPLLMTIKGGFLSKQGLEPNYTVATPDNPIDKNLLAGTAHLSQSAPAVSFASLERGEDQEIVHFASINDRDGFYLTARESYKDFKWSDLEGQNVLVDHWQHNPSNRQADRIPWLRLVVDFFRILCPGSGSSAFTRA